MTQQEVTELRLRYARLVREMDRVKYEIEDIREKLLAEGLEP